MFNKALCLTALLAMCTTLMAQECKNALEDALESFGRQSYAEIITRLTDCPPERLVERMQKIMAYDLLAQAYFVTGRVDSAKAVINQLLDLKSSYAPQRPQYAEEFIGIVKEIKNNRARQKPRSIFRNKWFWLGSVAASSVAAFLIFTQEESALLPEAPDPPEIP